MALTLVGLSSSLHFQRIDHGSEINFHKRNNNIMSYKTKQPIVMIKNNNPHDQNHPTTTDHRISKACSRHDFEKLIKETKQVLSKMGSDQESLVMIDAVQRLGIEYHFNEEIETILGRHYVHFNNGNNNHDEYRRLYQVSTCFRLLRQQGYYVSADNAFKKFKNSKDGKFKKELTVDIKGLMGLYEASQLNIGSEDLVLDEAGEFSARFLNASIGRLCDREARMVGNTLKHPYHKSLARFMAKDFLKDFSGLKDGWPNMVKELARMDFDMIQTLHQKEVIQVSKWWKDKGLARDLKFARDQPAKWYLWPMATITNPKFSEQRVELTKPVSFIYLIDDIFDVYGSLDQLTLFAKAIERWDFRMVEQLPECMKICFRALDDVINDFSCKVFNQRGFNPVDILRKAWSNLCNAFLVESRWFVSGNLPNAEDYLKNGIISSGVPLALLHLFFLLETDINSTMAANNLLNDSPLIFSSISTIFRLSDDLGSNKDENQTGEDGSYVDCFMKDHNGCSVEMARNNVMRMISNEWKCINRECLISLQQFSPILKDCCVNTARMVPLMYNYDQNNKLPLLEKFMPTMLHKHE
ncbi:(3S,6E)-nerolidol synthase 1-like [Impatiens glandulifera]|uniref:(3S,6E)-nerolidol synthase 1-like n=1 Tax=Impatiens glandulifera TaxID=253017 RepID=UPI001FB12157|nr:(3S,6E)-nerolidol synthase 1-like [Impatiens glandulifera]